MARLALTGSAPPISVRWRSIRSGARTAALDAAAAVLPEQGTMTRITVNSNRNANPLFPGGRGAVCAM
jgi:hypothetical protein